MAVLIPVVEEVLFRGFLLHRWELKWGIRKAVLFSSILFAAMHPDLIGAFLFGFAMAILYLRTGSLLAPIVCHMMTNALAWALSLGELLYYGTDYEWTLAGFQRDWWIAAVCLALTAHWAYRFISENLRDKAWSLPPIR